MFSGHTLQVVAPSTSLKCLGPSSRHDTHPLDVPLDPAQHLSHDCWLREYIPSGHVLHTLAPFSEYDV